MKELAGLMVTMDHVILPAGFKIVLTLPVTEVNGFLKFISGRKLCLVQ